MGLRVPGLGDKDWRNGRSLIPDLPLNQREARRAVGIYNRLRIPDVASTPSFGEAGADWFREIIAAIFGSYDPSTGVRHVRENFNLVPKKNSKTTNGAALMMTALLMNRRPRAEFLLTGPTHDVSELAFNQTAGMIECDQDGFLQKRMHVQQHLKIITDRRTKARLKVKTFDASVATGPKPAGVLVDELHQIGKIANADKIIGQLRGGLVSQLEGFLIFITTQSDDPPAGIFRDELMKARAIRDGRPTGRWSRPTGTGRSRSRGWSRISRRRPSPARRKSAAGPHSTSTSRIGLALAA